MPVTRRRFVPWYLPENTPLVFPDPRQEHGHNGLVAVGGDLEPERLLIAYSHGIFPWFSEDSDILWWSPDPRAVIEVDEVHLSRSLERKLHQGRFAFSINRAFLEVMRGCADRAEGTWILPSMLEAYVRLHTLGFAHSIEVWQDETLVGGLYGVSIGTTFAAESMFHRVTDASKAALVVAVRSLRRLGVSLFDVQYQTLHLTRMGAREIRRDDYLRRLHEGLNEKLDYSQLELDYRR